MTRSAAVILICAFSCGCMGQSTAQTSATEARLVIGSLPPLTYPPIALAAHVSGNVDLSIDLQRDGTISSLRVNSGPEMLRQPALENARQLKLECGECSEVTTTFHLNLRFELGPPVDCSKGIDSSYPKVAKSGNTITIAAQPMQTCDPATSIETVRARSWRCLFLWKCGWRKVD